jgi:hypothetical protein
MSNKKDKKSSSKSFPGSSLTGDVIVTIKATSAADAESKAKGIPGFTIDASVDVLDWGNGQYTVVGNAAQPIASADVVAVDLNGQAHASDPDSQIQ